MNNAVALYTLTRKEVTRWTRIWKQTLLPSAVTMTLYFVIFGNLIGSQIDDMRGFPYIQFIVPGLVMMAVITNSYSNVASSFYAAKWVRNIDELLVSPTPNYIILLGYVLGSVLRGLSVGILVLGVGLFFTSIQIYNLSLVVLFIILTSTLFALMGLINGIFARSFDDVSIVPTFVLTPLTYLGGVFYSIDMLPPLWQAVSKLNPILYMVNGFRYGFLGVSDVDVIFSLIMILAFSVVLTITALYLLKNSPGLRS